MNIRIEIELAYKDDVEKLELMLDKLADLLKDEGYANVDDDKAEVNSFIRVRKLIDDEILMIVVPIKDSENES